MIQASIEVFFFSILLSALTVGISIASTKGALLYPIYEWLVKRKAPIIAALEAEKEKELRIIAALVQASSNANATDTSKANYELDVIKAQKAISRIEEKQDNIYTWEKPVLMCIKCMPSFWGLLLNISFKLALNPLLLLLAICLSCVINTLLVTNKLIIIDR